MHFNILLHIRFVVKNLVKMRQMYVCPSSGSVDILVLFEYFLVAVTSVCRETGQCLDLYPQDCLHPIGDNVFQELVAKTNNN